MSRSRNHYGRKSYVRPITPQRPLIRRRGSMIVRHGLYQTHDVLPFVMGVWYDENGKFVRNREYQGYQVDMGSIRYKVFREKGLKCATCGIEGTVWALESHDADIPINRAHFNLYALRPGGWVLMTVDHIVPKSKGGNRVMSNLQPMCADCNVAKGNTYDAPLDNGLASEPSENHRVGETSG